MLDLNSHDDKTSVDLLNLGIPTRIPTDPNVNVNNYNNSQVTGKFTPPCFPRGLK